MPGDAEARALSFYTPDPVRASAYATGEYGGSAGAVFPVDIDLTDFLRVNMGGRWGDRLRAAIEHGDEHLPRSLRMPKRIRAAIDARPPGFILDNVDDGGQSVTEYLVVDPARATSMFGR